MAVKKRLIDVLEEEAVEQLAEVRALRTNRSEGSFDENMKRAKVALGVLGGYVRLRATIANEETNRLVAMRVEAAMPAALSSGE